MTVLADELQERAGKLAERLTRESWNDPFWEKRFGARGRKFSDEDGRHHVNHLVEALRLGSPEVLERYVRWLQTVLTTRGMCSRHIVENLERLARAIEEERLPEAEKAGEFLAAGVRALRRSDGAGAKLDEASERLARAAMEALAARDPAWTTAFPDMTFLASYLADAAANGRPDLFANHVRWCASSGLPSLAMARVHEAVAALETAAGAEPELAQAAAPAFAAVRTTGA